MTMNHGLKLIGKPFAYEPSGAPVFLSGGRALTLRMSVDEGTATIYLDDGASPPSTVAKGAVTKIAADYAAACRPVRGGGRHLAVAAMLALVCAAIVMLAASVTATGKWLAAPTGTGAFATDVSEDEAFAAFMEALRANAAPRAGQGLPVPGGGQSRPNVQIPAPVGTDPHDRFGLPSYQPASQADTPPKHEGEVAGQPSDAEVAASGPGTPAAADETSPAERAETSDEPAASIPGNEPSAADSPIQEEEEAAAREAAQKMVADGMSQEAALNVLSILEDLGNAETVTPEMLSTLPHEVARILVEGGLVEETAPDGTPYSIIRLPPEVLDAHRGPDGIPSIPERDTWAATGNFVSIPLPGGGDIGKPEDMLEFGLQP